MLSFWLKSDGRGYIGIIWNYSSLLGPTILPAKGWINFQFPVAASYFTTPLEFEFNDAPGYLGLDDISLKSYIRLTPVTSAAAQILSPQVADGFITFSFKTGAGQSYTFQQSTNLLN